MTIFFLIVIGVLLALLAGQTWILLKVVRRNETLTFDIEDRDRSTFGDIRTMFALMEQRDDALQSARDAHVCLEMVLNGHPAAV